MEEWNLQGSLVRKNRPQFLKTRVLDHDVRKIGGGGPGSWISRSGSSSFHGNPSTPILLQFRAQYVAIKL